MNTDTALPGRNRPVFALAIAWLVMIVAGTMGWAMLVAAPHHSVDEPLSELVPLFAVTMSIPFLFLLSVAHLPAVVLARRLARLGRLGLSLVGTVAAPLAMLVMAASTRILWPPVRPTVWDDVAFLLGRPAVAISLMIPLVAGGAVLGVLFPAPAPSRIAGVAASSVA